MSDPPLMAVRESDLPHVVSLNESAVPAVNSVDAAFFRQMMPVSECFLSTHVDGALGGFLLLLPPGLDYDSLNYRWFCNHYQDFAYIDRVAVAAEFRRKGLASSLYEDFAASVPDSVPFMTCEVNIKPPNADSMRFHSMLGFEHVGTQLTEHGTKEVALLAKPLQPD